MLFVRPLTKKEEDASYAMLENKELKYRVRKKWLRKFKFTQDKKEAIIKFSEKSPREHGLGFTNWSLKSLQYYLIKRKVVKNIGHETIRQILKKHSMKYRRSRARLVSRDQIMNQKKRIENLYQEPQMTLL
ncbi:MAG: hypothetical protein QXY96_06630 [Candidatus Methanomethylicaceae archaeon]